MEKEKNIIFKCEEKRMSIGILLMYSLYWVYNFIIRDTLLVSNSLKNLLGMIVLYVFGFGLFLGMIRKIPDSQYIKKNVSKKTIAISFLLQISAFMFVTIISMIINTNAATTPNGNNDLSPYMLFQLIFFAPLMEEIIFRKIFAEKLLKYGGLFYIIISSLCFSLIHLPSVGFVQTIYTFFLGLIWSYLMVKSGNIVLVIIMHSASNIFASILPQLLLTQSELLAGVYMGAVVLLGSMGFIYLLIYLKNNKQKTHELHKRKQDIKNILMNKGIIVYSSISFIVYLLNILF